MKRLIYVIETRNVSIFAGCHHRKQTYPPDTYPEGNTRRRRGVGEVIYTIYPITTPPSVSVVVDADSELSNFFTKCLQEKTGSVFRSWKSVVDFVIRDMRWYSSTEEQYCRWVYQFCNFVMQVDVTSFLSTLKAQILDLANVRIIRTNMKLFYVAEKIQIVTHVVQRAGRIV